MFNNMDEIEEYLTKNGYIFDSDSNRLVMKKNERFAKIKPIGAIKIKDYVQEREFTVDAYGFLINKLNMCYLGVEPIDKGNIPITTIDFSIIRKYNKRELEIKSHKALLKDIQDNGSDLIVTFNRVGERTYYKIKDDEAIEIHPSLVDSNLNDALQVEFISDVRKSLKDDFKNKYESDYLTAKELWDKVEVNSK